MNSNALLALLGDLYAQLAAAQDRIAELEHELATRDTRSDNGPVGSSQPTEAPDEVRTSGRA
jgi:hypothetical protein